MEQGTLESVQFTPLPLDRLTHTGSLHLTQQLLQSGARTLQCGEWLHMAHRTATNWPPALLSTDEAILRFSAARSVARAHGTAMKVFACPSSEGGSFDSLLDRAMKYVPFVDVLCFESPTPNNSNAIGFAAALQEAFPKTQLAFLYVPRMPRAGAKNVDHTLFAASLRRLGYVYYLCSPFTQGVIPITPIQGSWVLFDDLQAREHVNS